MAPQHDESRPAPRRFHSPLTGATIAQSLSLPDTHTHIHRAMTDSHSAPSLPSTTAPPTPAAASQWQWWRQYGPILAVMGSALIVFGPALNYEWNTVDDAVVFGKNPYLDPPTWAGLWELIRQPQFLDYNPVAWAAVWLQAQLFDPQQPTGFRAVSIGLHVLNIWLVWLVVQRLVPGRPKLALGVTWVFAVHPLNVEPVVWLSAQSWLISTSLGLLALLLIQRHADRWDADDDGRTSNDGEAGVTDKPQRQRRPWWPVSVGAMACMALAVLAKSGAVILPPVVFLWDWLVRGRPFWRAAQRSAPYFAVVIAIGATVQMQLSQSIGIGYLGGSLPMSLATHLPAVWDNFVRWFVPLKALETSGMHMALAFYYDTTPVPSTTAEILWAAAHGAVGLACLTALWWLAGRTRVATLGALWFLGGLALVAGIFPNQWWRFADRYNYLCCVGLILLVGLAIARLWHRYAPRIPNHRRYAVALSVVGIVSLIGLAGLQRSMWCDNGRFRMWQEAVVPTSFRMNFQTAAADTAPIWRHLKATPAAAQPEWPADFPRQSEAVEYLAKNLPSVLGVRGLRTAGMKLVWDYHLGPPFDPADWAARIAELRGRADAGSAAASDDPRYAMWTATTLFAVEQPEIAAEYARRALAHPRLRWAECVAKSREWATVADNAGAGVVAADRAAGGRWFVDYPDFAMQHIVLADLSHFLAFHHRDLIRQHRWKDADDVARVAQFLFADDSLGAAAAQAANQRPANAH